MNTNNTQTENQNWGPCDKCGSHDIKEVTRNTYISSLIPGFIVLLVYRPGGIVFLTITVITGLVSYLGGKIFVMCQECHNIWMTEK